MHDELLGTYLNDHLAGSELAIETLEHCRDHNADEPLKARLEELRRATKSYEEKSKRIVAF